MNKSIVSSGVVKSGISQSSGREKRLRFNGSGMAAWIALALLGICGDLRAAENVNAKQVLDELDWQTLAVPLPTRWNTNLTLPQSVVKELHELAENQQDARACNALGILYANGEGVAQDQQKALGYFRRASTLSENPAYDFNILVLEGDRLALLDRAARLATEKYPPACYLQARMGMREWSAISGKLSTSQQATFGERLTGLLEQSGDLVPAKLELAEVYRTGAFGVVSDLQKTETILRALIDRQIPVAELRLAKLLVTTGRSEECYPLILSAAEKGEPEALFCAAKMYMQGDHVEVDKPRSFRCIRQAAEAGQPQAMFLHSTNLYAGLDGNPPDRSTALIWLKKAAAHPKPAPAALYHLGMTYIQGDDGLNRDLTKGQQLVRRAASLGDVEAQKRVGEWAREELEERQMMKQIFKDAGYEVPSDALLDSALNTSGSDPYPAQLSPEQARRAGERAEQDFHRMIDRERARSEYQAERGLE
ncbi:MAG: SEL1-like repeat protein [Planctomycetaceae bacterium]|nr:SEL1-like repeat protein [Planctomycetaceae bacterium]